MAHTIKSLLIALLLLPVLILPARTHAQQPVERIAAVVNDEVISLSDVVSRLRLALLSSGLQATQENQQRLLPQVLRTLIDERLQRQAAASLNIRVQDEQIDQAIATIAGQNNMAGEQLLGLLRQNDIPAATLRDQVAAQIAWGQLVQRRLVPQINIGEEEIDEALARIEQNRGRPEYQVAEIFLGVDDEADEAEVRRLAESLVQQIRMGAPFSNVARQFSQAAGAAAGGDMGWVIQGQLDPALDQVLRQMRPGQVSAPVRTLTGYHILLLRDERSALSAGGGGELTVTLHQIGLPFPGGDPGRRESLVQRLRAETAELRGCAAFDRKAAELGVDNVEAGTGPLSRLPPSLRAIVGDLPVGEPSAPQVAADGVIVFMVCSRNQGVAGAPSREEISQGLRMERLDLLQRRYLRDLRNAAFIDVRL